MEFYNVHEQQGNEKKKEKGEITIKRRKIVSYVLYRKCRMYGLCIILN